MCISIPTIIWLDSNANNSDNSFLSKLSDYQNIQTFTDLHSCLSYINSHPDQVTFIMVSGTFASEIVPQIYELSNILMIFVFCASMQAHIGWAMDYCDKLMMFDHEDDLLSRLCSQTEEHLRDRAKEYTKQADEYKERAKRFNQACG